MLPHLFLFFCFLQIYDILVTYMGLSIGLTEKNPLAVAVFSYGILAAILYKVAGVIVVFKFGQFLQAKNWYYALYFLAMLDIVYLLIMIYNTYLYVVFR